MMRGMRRCTRGILLGIVLLTVMGVGKMPWESAAYGEGEVAVLPPSPEIRQAYEQLAVGLKNEVRLLDSIRDTTGTQGALAPVKKQLNQFADQRKKIDEEALWRYINNTPDLKQPLIETLELLFLQLQRLKQANYYGNAKLRQLLSVQFKLASERPRR